MPAAPMAAGGGSWSCTSSNGPSSKGAWPDEPSRLSRGASLALDEELTPDSARLGRGANAAGPQGNVKGVHPRPGEVGAGMLPWPGVVTSLATLAQGAI